MGQGLAGSSWKRFHVEQPASPFAHHPLGPVPGAEAGCHSPGIAARVEGADISTGAADDAGHEDGAASSPEPLAKMLNQVTSLHHSNP